VLDSSLSCGPYVYSPLSRYAASTDGLSSGVFVYLEYAFLF